MKKRNENVCNNLQQLIITLNNYFIDDFLILTII